MHAPQLSMHLYHLQSSLFHRHSSFIQLFSHRPSILFVVFTTSPHILLFSSAIDLLPFSPCVQTTSTHCCAQPTNSPNTCSPSHLIWSINITPQILLSHHLLISITFKLFFAFAILHVSGPSSAVGTANPIYILLFTFIPITLQLKIIIRHTHSYHKIFLSIYILGSYSHKMGYKPGILVNRHVVGWISIPEYYLMWVFVNFVKSIFKLSTLCVFCILQSNFFPYLLSYIPTFIPTAVFLVD